MTKKKAVRPGKMLLLAGLGLCSLVVLEAHQKMVEALDLKNVPAIASLQLPAPPAPTTTQPSIQLSPHPQRQTLAINSGSPQSDPQPVSQVTPSQLVTAIWRGASFPVENFQAYTSPFGYRLSPSGSYTQEFHYGLDMAAPQGSYVRNWWTGTVVEVTDNTNCGTSVVVESGSWLHIYCHMQGHVESGTSGRYMVDREGGLQIWEGQAVRAGERIGRVGMTGRTTGPHLHWGLKYNNNWVDPALVLRAMYSSQQTAARPNSN